MINSARPTSNQSTTVAWIYVIGSVLYFFSPIDLMPNIPIIRHIDALLILVSSLNLAQAYLSRINDTLTMFVKTLKIGVILLAILTIGILAIAGTARFHELG